MITHQQVWLLISSLHLFLLVIYAADVDYKQVYFYNNRIRGVHAKAYYLADRVTSANEGEAFVEYKAFTPHLAFYFPELIDDKGNAVPMRRLKLYFGREGMKVLDFHTLTAEGVGDVLQIIAESPTVIKVARQEYYKQPRPYFRDEKEEMPKLGRKAPAKAKTDSRG